MRQEHSKPVPVENGRGWIDIIDMARLLKMIKARLQDLQRKHWLGLCAAVTVLLGGVVYYVATAGQIPIVEDLDIDHYGVFPGKLLETCGDQLKKYGAACVLIADLPTWQTVFDARKASVIPVDFEKHVVLLARYECGNPGMHCTGATITRNEVSIHVNPHFKQDGGFQAQSCHYEVRAYAIPKQPASMRVIVVR